MQKRDSMTVATIQALETEYRRVAARLCAIADELAAIAKPGGRDMTKSEINAMWGAFRFSTRAMTSPTPT